MSGRSRGEGALACTGLMFSGESAGPPSSGAPNPSKTLPRRVSPTGASKERLSAVTRCSGAMPRLPGHRKSGQSAVVELSFRRNSPAWGSGNTSMLMSFFPFHLKEGVMPPRHSIFTQLDRKTMQTKAAGTVRVRSFTQRLFFQSLLDGLAELVR